MGSGGRSDGKRWSAGRVGGAVVFGAGPEGGRGRATVAIGRHRRAAPPRLEFRRVHAAPVGDLRLPRQPRLRRAPHPGCRPVPHDRPPRDLGPVRRRGRRFPPLCAPRPPAQACGQGTLLAPPPAAGRGRPIRGRARGRGRRRRLAARPARLLGRPRAVLRSRVRTRRGHLLATTRGTAPGPRRGRGSRSARCDRESRRAPLLPCEDRGRDPVGPRPGDRLDGRGGTPAACPARFDPHANARHPPAGRCRRPRHRLERTGRGVLPAGRTQARRATHRRAFPPRRGLPRRPRPVARAAAGSRPRGGLPRTRPGLDRQRRCRRRHRPPAAPRADAAGGGASDGRASGAGDPPTPAAPVRRPPAVGRGSGGGEALAGSPGGGEPGRGARRALRGGAIRPGATGGPARTPRRPQAQAGPGAAGLPQRAVRTTARPLEGRAPARARAAHPRRTRRRRPVARQRRRARQACLLPAAVPPRLVRQTVGGSDARARLRRRDRPGVDG